MLPSDARDAGYHGVTGDQSRASVQSELNQAGDDVEYRHTDGTDGGFVALSQELEDHFNALAGGQANRQGLARLNTLEHIHDAVVAYDGDMPVGCASFRAYEGDVAEIKRVYVRPAHRGKRIGRELMGQIESRAKDKGYRKVILETGRQFAAAVGLYESLGYKVIANYGEYAARDASCCFEKMLI